MLFLLQGLWHLSICQTNQVPSSPWDIALYVPGARNYPPPDTNLLHSLSFAERAEKLSLSPRNLAQPNMYYVVM